MRRGAITGGLKKSSPSSWRASIAVAATLVLLLAGCGERPPIESVQRGYRGLAMEQNFNPRLIATAASANALPVDAPRVPPGGPAARTVFKNVQVLGDTSVGEFTRLMVNITAWVSPEQGCAYCHKPGEDFSNDTLYTKVVSRRMLQMTKHINADWQTHVAQTGVTCYTCHRGQPVPSNVWFDVPQPNLSAYAGNKAGQNAPSPVTGLSSLPYDVFTPFLARANDARVIGKTALPVDNRSSIKQAEWTYGLMMHMSQSLGVNCTYCHNSRSFAEWDSSTPQRGVAWYGIRMVRDVNTAYLEPLTNIFPSERRGPAGDVPKTNCATCHQGAYKPLYGVSHLANHPELNKVSLQPTGTSGLPALPASAPAMPATPAAAATTSNITVLFFAVGSPALAADSSQTLAPVVQALTADPAAKATISGYHSPTGDLAQNQELSKQRAFAVRDALKAAGVAEDRVVLEPPETIEASIAVEDAQARRVEVTVE